MREYKAEYVTSGFENFNGSIKRINDEKTYQFISKNYESATKEAESKRIDLTEDEQWSVSLVSLTEIK